MNWIKIGNETFYTKECEAQLSIESWAIIYLTIDIKSNPKYYDSFIDLYEKGCWFQINTNKFSARGCRIKTMDIDFGKDMSMSIRCENIDPQDISVRRGGIIDDILGETTFVSIGV